MFLLSVFTKHYGLYSGVVRGSLKKSASNYSEGNLVDFFWQARLHEHVGTAKCEVIKSYSGVLISNNVCLDLTCAREPLAGISFDIDRRYLRNQSAAITTATRNTIAPIISAT